jgi:hypothetical protein
MKKLSSGLQWLVKYLTVLAVAGRIHKYLEESVHWDVVPCDEVISS